MGGIHGKNAEFLYNAVEIAGVTDVSGIGVGEAEMADTTAMNDAGQSSLKGIPGGGSFTVTGLAAAGTTDHGGLGTAAKASGDDDFEFRPEGSGAGKGKITGNAAVTAYTQSAAFGGAVQWSATFACTIIPSFGVQS